MSGAEEDRGEEEDEGDLEEGGGHLQEGGYPPGPFCLDEGGCAEGYGGGDDGAEGKAGVEERGEDGTFLRVA